MRRWVGAIIWILIAIAVCIGWNRYVGQQTPAAQQLVEYWTEYPSQVELEFESPMPVRVGDPVMQFEGDVAKMVGVICHVESPASIRDDLVTTTRAYAQLFGAAPDHLAGMELTYHSTPDSIEWVIQTMLPPATRQRISQLVVDAYRENQSEILAELRPVLEKTFDDATQIMREEFRQSVQRRDQQIQKLSQRYQDELVDEKLVPLVQQEIWPVIERLGQPLVIDIGRQLWAEASIWRFGWRLLYDQTPLPQRNLTHKEFERFVSEKARPIIQEKLPDIIATQQEMLAEISRNEKVRDTVSDSIRTVIRDEEFQALIADIMKDVLVDNEKLHEVLVENWNTPEAQQALEITNRRLEPTVTKIGQTLFGSPDSQITPEFSRVLRSQIMQKDQRWFVLRPTNSSSGHGQPVDRIQVRRGKEEGRDPFYFPRRPRQ